MFVVILGLVRGILKKSIACTLDLIASIFVMCDTKRARHVLPDREYLRLYFNLEYMILFPVTCNRVQFQRLTSVPGIPPISDSGQKSTTRHPFTNHKDGICQEIQVIVACRHIMNKSKNAFSSTDVWRIC